MSTDRRRIADASNMICTTMQALFQCNQDMYDVIQHLVQKKNREEQDPEAPTPSCPPSHGEQDARVRRITERWNEQKRVIDAFAQTYAYEAVLETPLPDSSIRHKEIVAWAVQDLRDRAWRSVPSPSAPLAGSGMFFERSMPALPKRTAEYTLEGRRAPEWEFDDLDLIQGLDVHQVQEASPLSEKLFAEDDGVHGLPRSCPYKCNYCSRVIGDRTPWTIYVRKREDGRWECLRLFDTPGCVMRVLESLKLNGIANGCKSNTALVIRRRLNLSPQDPVPIAPHLCLREDHGGPIPVETWYRIAEGNREITGDVHVEYAPGGFLYGKEGCVVTVVTGNSHVHNYESRIRWAMSDGSSGVCVKEDGGGGQGNRHHHPSLSRISTRDVPEHMRSSLLYNDPMSEEGMGGRDHSAMLSTQKLAANEESQRLRAERAAAQRSDTQSQSQTQHPSSQVDDVVMEQSLQRRPSRLLYEMYEQKRQEEREEIQRARSAPASSLTCGVQAGGPAGEEERKSVHFAPSSSPSSSSSHPPPPTSSVPPSDTRSQDTPSITAFMDSLQHRDECEAMIGVLMNSVDLQLKDLFTVRDVTTKEQYHGHDHLSL